MTYLFTIEPNSIYLSYASSLEFGSTTPIDDKDTDDLYKTLTLLGSACRYIPNNKKNNDSMMVAIPFKYLLTHVPV